MEARTTTGVELNSTEVVVSSTGVISKTTGVELARYKLEGALVTDKKPTYAGVDPYYIVRSSANNVLPVTPPAHHH